MNNTVRPRVVLAFSGSVASSAAVSWLADQYGADVIAVTLDLGQSGELEALRSSALALGARRAHVLDARDEFARDCILPSLQRGAPLLSRGLLAAPLLASTLTDIAAMEQATLVAHAGDRADHDAIEAGVHARAPHLRVIAAAVEWNMAPAGLEAYAVSRGVAVSPPAQPGRRSKALEVPAHLEVAFDRGVPVAVNGVAMTLTELIESVATIAHNHGIGGVLPVRARTMYEAPAAIVLCHAHHALMAGAPEDATGVVRLKLFKGVQTILEMRNAACGMLTDVAAAVPIPHSPF